jgi:hypothetical protein
MHFYVAIIVLLHVTRISEKCSLLGEVLCFDVTEPFVSEPLLSRSRRAGAGG